jgi:hypothetical protein
MVGAVNRALAPPCWREKVKILPMKLTVPLGLFVIGAACFSVIFLFPQSTRPFVILGGAAWTSSYLWVVVDNFRRRAPVPMRNRMLRYEEKPRTYKLVYGLMMVLGICFLLILIALNIFP